MKILMLCLEFPPVNTTGNFRSAGFARYFVQNGAEVCVLTADEQSQMATFKKTSDHSLMDGLERVIIHRFPIRPLALIWKSKLGNFVRIWWNLTDSIDKRWYRGKNISSINRVIKNFKPDCLYVSLPPFSMARAAMTISKRWNLPLISDMRDAWSLWGVSPFQTPFHYRLIKKLESRLFKHSKLILSVTEELGGDFLSQHPQLSKSKLKTIFNGYDAVLNTNVNTKNKLNSGHNKQLRIGYVGSFYYSPKAEKVRELKWYKRKGLQKLYYWPRKENWIYRSPYFFLKTLSCLIREKSEYRKRILFEHIGHCPDWLYQMVKDFNLEPNFISHGFQSKKNVLEIQNTWHGILATSEEVVDGLHYCLPSKSFDMVASKKTILGFLTPGSQRAFYENVKQFELFEPKKLNENVIKLADLVDQGLSNSLHPSKLTDFYSRDTQAAILLEAMKTLKVTFNTNVLSK